MSAKKRRSACVNGLVGALVVAAVALFAQGAQAAISPSLSLDQSSGTQAGGTANLGMNMNFGSTGLLDTDSPDVLTINLPPGLLANASIDNGACLTTADLNDTNCQVGTGTVTAYALVGLNVGPLQLVQLPVDVTFDLVPPPAPGDLAGLAVNMDGQQIGQTADIKVRPSGDPNGVGLTISLVLPNSLDGAPIEITEIDSTFDGLRYPTTCPSTPARVSVSVDSYQDSTVKTISQPLNVTGCSSLTYTPKVAVKVAKDSADREVGVTATVTQGATESPTKSLSLGFPGSTLGVNLAAIKLLCANASSGTCTPVGHATATSPLYPKPLSANAYLTGTALGPTLTLVFPAPFPLTLVGNVSLTARSASFTGLPDIPLTTLSLNFNGGPEGMFLTNCSPGDGSAVGSSTDQNGDKTVSASVPYQISGCAASSYTSTSTAGSVTPTVSAPAGSGFKTRHPSLRFTVKDSKKGGKLKQLTIKLPRGLSFTAHRTAKRTEEITGVKLTGAKIKALSLSGGRLVIKLRKPAASVGVTLTGDLLDETPAMVAKAKAGKLGRTELTVTTLDVKNKRHTISKTIKL